MQVKLLYMPLEKNPLKGIFKLIICLISQQLVSAGICVSVKDVAVFSGRTLGTELSCEGITVTSFQLHYPQSDIALRILFGKHRICAVFAKIHLSLFHCNLPFVYC